MTPDNVNSGMEGFTSIARPDLSTLFGDGSAEQGVSRRRLNSSNAMEEERGLSFLGFKSDSFWQNIGSVAQLIIVGYLLLVFVYIVARVVQKVAKPEKGNNCSNKIMVKFRDLLFWNGVIYLLMLGVNVIFTAAFISFKMSDDDEGGSANLLFAIAACTVYGLFVFASIYLFRKYREVLHEPSFERTYGAMSESLRTSSMLCLSYVAVFVLRRGLLVLILVNGNKAFSLYGTIILQVLYCAYLCGIRPMYRAEHTQEIITEYMFLVLACFSLLYTDYVRSAITRRSIGYVQLTLISIFLVYKILYILFASFRGLWLFVKRCRNRCCHKGKEKQSKQTERSLVEEEGEIEQAEHRKGGARRALTRYMTVSINSPGVHNKRRNNPLQKQ